MKSAYELAMERLESEDSEVSKPLTGEQRQQLEEISTRYKAKMAERDIFLQKQLRDAEASGNLVESEQIRKQMALEKERLEVEMEEKKEKVRKG